MTSDNELRPTKSTSALVKMKRQRAAPLVSIAATQSCIADAMAKVIGNMINPMVQLQCLHMLNVNNFQQVQGKILELLQQIDFDILEEQEKRDKRDKQKVKAKKKSKK